MARARKVVKEELVDKSEKTVVEVKSEPILDKAEYLFVFEGSKFHQNGEKQVVDRDTALILTKKGYGYICND
jgi:hypothetical protein